jgi:NAD(P)-dependent dehydrogenase (short-subunit alcohol dehydrogenase family)
MNALPRVVLITGASRGIGRALVRAFRDGGWAVAACARDVRAVQEAGPDLAFACDVTDLQQVRSGLGQVLARLGRLDAVVNNAGLAGANSLDPEASDDLWHRILAVNLTGAYHVAKHALPLLPDGSGRILNVASVLALRGVPDQTAYCAAKHGLLGFTRALALHAAPRRITVNAICPGWVRTEMALARMQELGWSEDRLQSSVPLQRWIQPEEVAALALYLASEAAAGITGQALTVDGGALA